MRITHIRAIGLAAALSMALGGCERSPEAPATAAPVAAAPTAAATGEMEWARAALERNPNLEVLAVDAGAGVFTVRDRGSGEVQAVPLAELVATPRFAASEPAPSASYPARAEDGTDPDADASATPGAETLDYTVERSGGQVRVSGPGLSIVSAGAGAAPAAARDTSRITVDPIICEGERVMQINDRRIFVEGDAIVARGGCQLHITNSRIGASRTGVVVRDAVVHITNSEIEGRAGSFHAGEDAKVFLQGATLKGAMRRDEGAAVEELGPNQWQ